jgi:hypothetical protein
MGPLAMAGIGAALGLGKNLFFDAPKEKAQRRLAAETARFSPWTGLSSSSVPITPADPLGSVIQGGLTGASMGQNYGLWKKMLDEAATPGIQAPSLNGSIFQQGLYNVPPYAAAPAAPFTLLAGMRRW